MTTMVMMMLMMVMMIFKFFDFHHGCIVVEISKVQHQYNYSTMRTDSTLQRSTFTYLRSGLVGISGSILSSVPPIVLVLFITEVVELLNLFYFFEMITFNFKEENPIGVITAS